MENFTQNKLPLEAPLFMFQTILSAVHSTVQSCHLLGIKLSETESWLQTY